MGRKGREKGKREEAKEKKEHSAEPARFQLGRWEESAVVRRRLARYFAVGLAYPALGIGPFAGLTC